MAIERITADATRGQEVTDFVVTVIATAPGVAQVQIVNSENLPVVTFPAGCRTGFFGLGTSAPGFPAIPNGRLPGDIYFVEATECVTNNVVRQPFVLPMLLSPPGMPTCLNSMGTCPVECGSEGAMARAWRAVQTRCDEARSLIESARVAQGMAIWFWATAAAFLVLAAFSGPFGFIAVWMAFLSVVTALQALQRAIDYQNSAVAAADRAQSALVEWERERRGLFAICCDMCITGDARRALNPPQACAAGDFTL